MTPRAFPYVGHGASDTDDADSMRVFVVFADASRVETFVASIASWATTFDLKIKIGTDGGERAPIVDLRARGFRRLGAARVFAHTKLDDLLLANAGSIALVVRESNRVKTSAWHDETLTDPARILDVLARAVSRTQKRYARQRHHKPKEQLDMRELLLATIADVHAELARETLAALVRGARSREARAVLDDVFEERLPALLGRDFDLDVVLREAIAGARGLSATSIVMRDAFYRESERRMTARHDSFSTPQRVGKSKVDWTRVKSIRAAMKKPNALRALAFAFDYQNPEHRNTMLALTHDERMKLVTHDLLALHVANAAAHFLARREFRSALALYDAAIEGNLPVTSLANPLYVVQNDNNHFGIEVARARRYLERCVVASAEENPAIFLNGSCVAMELGEPDEAMRLLKLAKKHGLDVKEHRNEALFIPLRARADFVKLMK